MAHASICDVSGAASPRCKVKQAIRNVRDRPETLRRRPAGVNLLRPVEFKTIPQPRILDAWHRWRNTSHAVLTRDFLAIFGPLLDRVHVRILTSDFHHWTLQKKAYKIREYVFGAQFSVNPSSFAKTCTKLAVLHLAGFSTWKLQVQPYGVLGIDRRVFHCPIDEHDVMAISQRSNAW